MFVAFGFKALCANRRKAGSPFCGSQSVRQMGPLPSCFVALEEKKCYCRSWWLGSHRAECGPPSSPFPSFHPTFGDNAASAVSDPTDVGCFRRPKSVGRPLGLIAIALCCCCRVAFCCFYKAGDGSDRQRELKWMGATSETMERRRPRQRSSRVANDSSVGGFNGRERLLFAEIRADT